MDQPMTAGSFKQSLAFVLKDEGGNDDDPDDHGGRTSRGITQKEYNAWRLERHLPAKDVWTASAAEVTTIYHDEYWNPWCDSFPTGIDYMYFDIAVNAGPHEATVLLQRALGVADDGRIGPITRTTLKLANPSLLIDRYTQAKKAFYISLHNRKYIGGWLNRCRNVHDNALNMLRASK
jgi:lysozyme family protein